jgi:CRISPR-associated protein Cas1
VTDRILDFADAPARLNVRNRLLVVRRDEWLPFSVPLADLAVVIVSHSQVTYTQAVLAGLAEAGAAFVACNGKHLPIGMLLPLVAHFSQAERFAAQARAALPTKKRLWRQVVRAKIRAQARTLETLHGTDHGLRALVAEVRSGDPANVEARAARRYWPLVFSESPFRRQRDNEDENLFLNYGYAVLRAIVARAICGVGLHPSLGIHHHNRYDPFCLADDLMEPFRPTVDLAVAEYVTSHDTSYGIDKAAKQHLVEALTRRYSLGGRQRTIFDAAARLASSLADVFLGKGQKLELPRW